MSGTEPSRVNILKVSSLSKRYGDRDAVRNVSFDIRSGEVFGLLGPNGAGKTTTIGIIATIVAPSQGEVRVGGPRVETLPEEVRSRIGLVPQSLCLYPSLTAEENLVFLGRMYDLGEEELAHRVGDVHEQDPAARKRDLRGGHERFPVRCLRRISAMFHCPAIPQLSARG